jgi:hypothetical protein
MSTEFEKFQQSILAIVAQLQQDNQLLRQENENRKEENQQQQKQITALKEKADDLQNLHYGTSERFLMFEQNKRHAEKEIEKLKEENQQLKRKNDEIQPQLQFVETLRKEAKIIVPEYADDVAVKKSIDECKFPLFTERIDFSNRGMITDVSIQRIVAACPNVTEIHLSGCERLSDGALNHVASLRHLESLDLAGCRQLTDASLRQFASLRNLKSFNLYYCKSLIDGSLKHI